MVKKTNLEWADCSEDTRRSRIRMEAAGLFGADTLVFLEGEMGAGKSTFVRVLLEDLCPGAKSLGSPTFPLVQTYRTSGGMWIYHIDLYRLKSARECPR